LIVDFDLPEPETLPKLKGVRFVAARDKLEESFHKASFLESMYDNLIYQTSLAVVHLIYKSDIANILQAIAFNGWVTYLNRATGQDTTACIVSLHVTRDEFKKINLLHVDPKICFRSLKGISSPVLHSMTPVRPLILLNKNDSRFVEGRDVIDRIGHGANIAAIGWEEFEQLIRELFEKEFSAGGGEVKITQASRDGGVDAIGFDPDPIRGGKIVIQAKRYTNTVDVSAVRDLFGTVMAEGAIKGILVTTSSFGPDAHRFAKGKPLTLMDGNNLLFLLEKHGHTARIDLSEAKRMANPLRR
jgi:restriction system protein